MLWYLLYPLRGTTEALVLQPTHPVRRAFARYGIWAARHAKTLLPLSGALLFSLLYPIPFLYTTDANTITSGVSNLPHHVWTDAHPLGNSASIKPDIIMRSIWVHGSYMRALDRDVLLGALELQDALLGATTDFYPALRARGPPFSALERSRDERDATHIIHGAKDGAWFYQSPLQYWNGSAERLKADDNIISTINNLKNLSTSVNVTLRHSTVFSGKRFEERRLAAADALVITLFYLGDSPVTRNWVREAETLASASRVGDKWVMIPEDGTTLSSRLYEFQFRPLSAKDWFFLTLAYSLTLTSLLLNLSKVRAFKSRVGLMATILAQIMASIGSSLTVCSILQLDLSRFPNYAYPLAVMFISMESSSKMIKSVITMPSNTFKNTSERIGEAFGATAPLTFASRAQNLLLLYVLSKITFPGVAAFCTFAAIAITFDCFYLSTFFLAVLSVDVRQLELSEMEKSSLEQRREARRGAAQTPAPHSANPVANFVDALGKVRVGEFRLSTRVAGTIIVVGFVLIAQAHYAPESKHRWLNWIFERASTSPDDIGSTSSPQLRNIHQARSQASWLRLQDHETAREVIQIIKPRAHSYVARIYEPIICVLRGAERTPPAKEPYFLPAVYDFLHHEVPSFMVLLVMVAAMLVLLTEYLLSGEFALADDDAHSDQEPFLSIKTLSRGHALDIAMVASADGHLVTIGLDRTVQVWDARSGLRTQIPCSPGSPAQNPFPVLSLAIDGHASWIAFLTTGRVLLWSMLEKRWGPSVEIELSQHKVEAFFFGPKTTNRIPSVIAVRRNGTMVELHPSIGESKDYLVCKTPLVQAVSLVGKEVASAQGHTGSSSFLTLTCRGCIHLVRQLDDAWLSEEVRLPERDVDVHSLVPITEFSMYLVARPRTVDLVDMHTSSIVHTFAATPEGSILPRSFGRVSFSAPRTSLSVRTAGVIHSFTFAYVEAETGDLIIQTYLPDPAEDAKTADEGQPSNTDIKPTISLFGDSASGGSRDMACKDKNGSVSICHRWSETRVVTKRIADPGSWEVLSNGSIVGVRRKRSYQSSKKEPGVSSSLFSAFSSPSSPPSGLRLRTAAGGIARAESGRSPLSPQASRNKAVRPAVDDDDDDDDDAWEVWVATHLETTSEYEAIPLSESRPGHQREERQSDGLWHRLERDRSSTAAGLVISELGPMAPLGLNSVAVGFGNVVKVVSVGHKVVGLSSSSTDDGLGKLPAARRKKAPRGRAWTQGQGPG